MKKINIVYVCLAFSLFTGCSDKLEEENHSNLTVDFFGTEQGFKSGLTAAYAGFRNIYGPEEGLHAFTNAGTDEVRTANSNRTSNMVDYASGYNASNEFSKSLWTTAYRYINTCNGLIDQAEALTGVSEKDKASMLGEAKFLRAQYYFLLVQSFGDCTLAEHYITTPETSASRADMMDVMDLIISDLTFAKANLPASSQVAGVLPGKATAAAARHLLSRVYLTYAWMHNRNDAKENGNYYLKYYDTTIAQQYFKLAYNEATSLITDAPTLGIGLLNDYRDVWKATNENNKEVLWNVQYASGYTDYGGNYPLNHLYVNSYVSILGQRDVLDGRPYSWYRCPDWVYNVAFADKAIDSRYEGTFQMVWYATMASGNKTVTGTVGGNAVTFNVSITAIGDTAMWMPGYNMTEAQIRARMNRGAGKNAYAIYTPELYNSRNYFPTMKKYLDPNRNNFNDNAMRPIIVYRLGETYLIAAEAALMQNDKPNAVKYINLLRDRAGYAGHKAEMAISEADVNIDFILDERTRELLGEHCRWFDLVRTGKLMERVKKYDDFEAHNNIKWFHNIRPIPQSQIDACITGDPYPQSNGWK